MKTGAIWGSLVGCGLLLLAATPRSHAAQDTVLADFEGADYGAWQSTGTAFGNGPAQGTLPRQMTVEGFQGRGLANSFVGGDDARGRLTSPPFVINRPYLAFLIGGGGWARLTCLNLLVDGKVVRSATGPNTRAGGSERLAPAGWDVKALQGKTARLEIVDEATGGWGHINVDHIVMTDTQPPLAAQLRYDATRTLTPAHKWLSFPVKNGAPRRTVTVKAGNQVLERFNIHLADDLAANAAGEALVNAPDWWAALDVSVYRGKPLTVTVDALPDTSRVLEQLVDSDTLIGKQPLYNETLRPQLHFSAQRGWLNDPNGLVYANGEYHLFFQHDPFTWEGGDKYWGHAVSSDLVHWREVEEALSPDPLGQMYSGSAVVDKDNTSGFGAPGSKPLVLIYTAAGDPFTQCIAYSTDGRHFTKYGGNPVVGSVTQDNRDPRVFWYAPTKRWVMAFWAGVNGHHTVQFYTSPDLKKWTLSGVTESTANSNFLFECPDIFPLNLDGDPNKQKWILTGADSQYAVGTFDGNKFTAETPPLPGHRGRGFYAAQTFNDEPQGRRVQVGWFQTETRDMPFNQSMTLPLELTLVSTKDGPRLKWVPVAELASLRHKTHTYGSFTLRASEPNPLADVKGELLELRAEFAPPEGTITTFTVRGVPIVYNAKTQEISVGGHTAPAPLRFGKQKLTIYADRVGLEVFASDGLTYVPYNVVFKPEEQNYSLATQGDVVAFSSLTAYELRSAWRQPAAAQTASNLPAIQP